jgi:hypothetical protein
MIPQKPNKPQQNTEIPRWEGRLLKNLRSYTNYYQLVATPKHGDGPNETQNFVKQKNHHKIRKAEQDVIVFAFFEYCSVPEVLLRKVGRKMGEHILQLFVGVSVCVQWTDAQSKPKLSP